MPLARGSAVTSGIYERCFTAPDGSFYHHILDPRTGMPAETDVAGVTVICEKSIDAEGFSTTLLALGLERDIGNGRRARRCNVRRCHVASTTSVMWRILTVLVHSGVILVFERPAFPLIHDADC